MDSICTIETPAIGRPFAWVMGIIASLLFVAFGILAPTEEDIKKCMDATNYTHERCEFELGR